MIRVVVLADSAILRAGLVAMLREDGRFDPSPGNTPFAKLRSHSSLLNREGEPCVVLAEITDKRVFSSLPPVLDEIEAESPHLVFLADDVSRNELMQALRHGVRALLRRVQRPAEE